MKKNDEIYLEGQKYHVHSQLGEGSYGQVLKIIDSQKNEYALKILTKRDENEENIMKKLKESRSQSHRNIVNFIQSGTFAGKYHYILMEYCDTDLYKQLQQKIVPQSDLRYIIVSIADGLQYLHDLNIIHRDLKPENVFVKILKVNQSQTQNIYKLGDFGCSTDKSISESSNIGTPYYMAPEIIKGEKYDKSVDIWALGTICYELLTGKPLFDGLTAESIYQLIMQQTDDSPYIVQKLKMLNDEYKKIVFQMLKVTPSQRPEIKEVIRALRSQGYKSPPRVQQYIPPPKFLPTSKLKINAATDSYEANLAQGTQSMQTIKKFIPNLNLKEQIQLDGPKSPRFPASTSSHVQSANQNKQPNQNIIPNLNFNFQIQQDVGPKSARLPQNLQIDYGTLQQQQQHQNQQQPNNSQVQNQQTQQSSIDHAREKPRFHSPQNQFTQNKQFIFNQQSSIIANQDQQEAQKNKKFEPFKKK